MTLIAGIVLAASDATIDGMPIALLPWSGDETLIEWQIRQLQDAGVDVVEVVVGYEAERIIPLVAGNDVEPILDPMWASESESAYRIGASAVPRDTERAILIDIVSPRAASACRTVLQAQSDAQAEIVAPAFEDVRGTPFVAGRVALAAIRNVGAGRPLADLFRHQAASTLVVKTGDPGVVATINDAESYERLRRRLAG